MSEALEALAEPLIDAVDGDDAVGLRRALTLAAGAWNAAVMAKKQQREGHAEIIENMARKANIGDAEDVESFREIMHMLIARKHALFPDDDRMVGDVAVVETSASSSPRRPTAGTHRSTLAARRHPHDRRLPCHGATPGLRDRVDERECACDTGAELYSARERGRSQRGRWESNAEVIGAGGASGASRTSGSPGVGMRNTSATNADARLASSIVALQPHRPRTSTRRTCRKQSLRHERQAGDPVAKPKAPTAAAASVFHYENRKGVTYYLHAGRTKSGKSRYFFARSAGEGALDSLPDGYEVAESINGVVSARRRRVSRSKVSADDLALVQAELRRHDHLRNHRAVVDGDAIVIYAPNVNEAEMRRLAQRWGTPWQADDLVADGIKRAHYDPVMKLVRTDAGYAAHRMTYHGHGGWSWVLRSGPLPQVVQAVVPVIGTERFFELL